MATSCIKILSIIIVIIIIIITITVNTIFKMGTPFPGSLKAQQNVNFARFTTHVLLPIFPEESWVLQQQQQQQQQQALFAWL